MKFNVDGNDRLEINDDGINVTGNITAQGTLITGNDSAGTVQSNGDYDLVLKTGNSTTGSITITNGANGNITLAPMELVM